MQGSSNNCTPHCETAGLPAAPAVAFSTAGPLIAPVSTTPALAVLVAYADSFQQSCRHSEILSAETVSSLQTSWTILTPSLDRQDIILAVNR